MSDMVEYASGFLSEELNIFPEIVFCWARSEEEKSSKRDKQTDFHINRYLPQSYFHGSVFGVNQDGRKVKDG
jgi:hypothetical protein